MKIDDQKIKEALLAGSYVGADDLVRAERESVARRMSVGDYLLNQNLVTRDILGQALAESYKMAYFDLNSNQPSRTQVLGIPEETATKYRIVLAKSENGGVVIATDNPNQDGLDEELKRIFFQQTIELAFSLPEDIDKIFTYYHQALGDKFLAIIKSDKAVAPRILEALFTDAVSLNVSDIHLEPNPEDTVVRFRVDGVLRDVGHLTKENYLNVINRIKVQSGLRLDEHLAAQDGAMQFKNGNLLIDLRISIVPTVEGEKVVMRVLNSYLEGLSLGDLGLSSSHQKKLGEVTDKPFGMVVVTGPTGSGKTTTLYALLKILNQTDVNITTIEDPVEYKIRGVNQIQVNSFTNLTFARGLRSIVRQDPDIILVGEIRDVETAEIAVNAALTGHLLLSTFHANDAATAIPRMIDMGVEPFLLSSTLELIISQRLVRRICDHCRQSVVLSPKDLSAQSPRVTKFFGKNKVTLYKGAGCEVCAHSGYRGRSAIFEFISLTPEMKELIVKSPATQEIWKLARSQGSQTMFEDGIEKVKSGLTTIDELLRVAEPPPDLRV